MTDDGGITRLRNRLQAIPGAVREAVTPALLRQANAMAGTMRALAPDDPATGEPDLKTSIEVTGPGGQTPPYSQPGGNMTVPELTVAVTVGGEDVRYPHLLEYGTTKMAAQPYFWPAVRLHRKKATAGIKRAVGSAVRKNWGKP